MEQLFSYLETHQSLVVTLSILSIVFFVGSLLSLPYLVSRLPQDYFLPRKRSTKKAMFDKPLLALLLAALKNTVGVILILAGIAMLVLPGQGIITILMGFALSNFPGKYAIERRLVGKPVVFNSLNWLRKKHGSPPLHHPQDTRQR